MITSACHRSANARAGRGFGRLNASRYGRRGSAYTLTEILVVAGIISLMLAMAVPAFNFISGGRTIESAQNMVTSMVARARSLALSQRRPFGVVIFRDPVSDRFAAYLAAVPVSPNWNSTQTYSKGDYVSDTSGNVYLSLANNNLNQALPAAGASNAAWFGVPPADFNSSLVLDVPNLYANTLTQSQLEAGQTLADSVLLPSNIAAQVIVNCSFDAGGNRTSENYLATGAILFSPNGMINTTRFTIYSQGALGNRIGLGTLGSSTTTQPQTLYSSLGVILYDRKAYRSAGFSETDLGTSQTTPPAYGSFTKGSTNEATEENWLDGDPSNQDSDRNRPVITTLVVNRYNGTMYSTE